VVAQIPVAPKPEQLVLRPGGRELYVVSESGALAVIRFPALRVSKAIPLPGPARSLAFSPDGQYFYATIVQSGSSEIVFGDAEHGRIRVGGSRVRAAYRTDRGPAPGQGGERPATAAYGSTSLTIPEASTALSLPARSRGERSRREGPEPKSKGRSPLLASVALTPDGKTLIVADTAHDRLIFLSSESGKVLGTVDVGKRPGAMVVLPNGSKVFVADTEEEKISAADVASHQILSHIEIGSKPSALLLKPDGGELFVLSAQGIVTIVDAFHDNVEQTFSTGRGTAAAVIRRDQSVLYLANAGDGSVTCLDVENRVVLNSTQVGTEPRALALTPDERFLVVADYGASSLAVLRADPRSRDRKGRTWMDPKRSLLITTVPVGAGPIDVVVPDWER
jgi:DNA-binding beta-propeller fold protein YncE